MENMQSNNKFTNEPHSSAKISEQRSKTNGLIVLLAIVSGVLLVGVITFCALFINSNNIAVTYGNTIESGYKKTFYELLDNVNDIELNLSKTQVSSNKALQQKYLGLVCDNCKYAQNNFGTLPVGVNTVNEGVKFINQMDGYCTSLIVGDETFTEEQKDTIKELKQITLELKASLNAIVTKLLKGYSILNNSNFNDEGLTNFSSNFQGLSADSISYPSMIFDGPFSDSLYNKEIKGLTGSEISKDEATEIVRKIFEGAENVEINFANETKGNFTTYDFEVKAHDRLYFVQVTKKGGFLLTLSSYGKQSETVVKDVSECEKIAEDFAKKLALNDMESVWSENLQGICFVNLAPVINSVTIYPDLIKVKIEMSTGVIIGWEAQNYAYNHTERTDLTPLVGATDARNLIDLMLNINTQKLCVMPLEYGGETLAYEFECEYYGSTYYVFINAKTGKEERVLKVVTTDEGSLTE